VGLVAGDPYGWQDIGYALSTLLGQLQSELAAADAAGGSGLAGSWSGPAASAYLADWGRRCSRYADLLWNAQQAASAIYDYGQRVADIVVQAGRLEAAWLDVGLELAEDGFRLPHDIESLPHVWQQNLRTALTESERDVVRIRADVAAACDDLWTAVRDALIALEDFQFIAVNGIARFGMAYLKKEFGTWDGLAHNGFDVTLEAFTSLEEKDLDETRDLATEMSAWLREGTVGERSVAGKWLPRLGRDSEQIDETIGPARRFAPVGSAAIALIPTAVDGYQDVRKDGWERGAGADLESHAGDMANAAAMLAVPAIIAAAPVELPAIGAIAVTSVVAFGVGEGVQAVVDHRQAIGHVIDEAAAWEDKHVLGWL
jgi:hypothetical protein